MTADEAKQALKERKCHVCLNQLNKGKCLNPRCELYNFSCDDWQIFTDDIWDEEE